MAVSAHHLADNVLTSTCREDAAEKAEQLGPGVLDPTEQRGTRSEARTRRPGLLFSQTAALALLQLPSMIWSVYRNP